jgi:CrcB protein
MNTTSLKPREFVIALSSVVVGGFIGTMLRFLLSRLEHIPSATLASTTWPQEIPWVLLTINFVGVYLATLCLRGPLRRHDPNNVVRLLVITGFFGGLTSYSSLYVDFSQIWHVSVGGCLLVALGAILSGVLAGWLGLMGEFK